MFHGSQTSKPSALALLLALASLGLAACGGASDPRAATAPSPQEVQAYNQQRAELIELVACAHRHGIPLPEPTRQLKVNTQGVNLKSHARKAAINACFHKVVNKATREANKRKEEQSFGQAGNGGQQGAEQQGGGGASGGGEAGGGEAQGGFGGGQG